MCDGKRTGGCFSWNLVSSDNSTLENSYFLHEHISLLPCSRNRFLSRFRHFVKHQRRDPFRQPSSSDETVTLVCYVPFLRSLTKQLLSSLSASKAAFKPFSCSFDRRKCTKGFLEIESLKWYAKNQFAKHFRVAERQENYLNVLYDFNSITSCESSVKEFFNFNEIRFSCGILRREFELLLPCFPFPKFF